MEYAFKRGWVYQETANTQLMPNRVQAFLHEHRGDRKILEAFFVRRGANLPLVMQKLREEKPMTEPELATIFAHLAHFHRELRRRVTAGQHNSGLSSAKQHAAQRGP